MKRDVSIWWRQAKEDLDTAFANYKIGKYYVCAFYSQQAVEKALKAVIIQETRQMPPRVHKLLELGKIILSKEQIKEIYDAIKKVDPGYILSRYPEFGVDKTPAELVDKRMAQDIFDQAERIILWLQKKFEMQK